MRLYTRRHAVAVAAFAGLSAVGLGGCEKSVDPASNTSTTFTTPEGWKLQEEGKLKVASYLDNMPFEGESGFQEMGFSVDLMEKIAEKLGLELEYLSSKGQDRVIAAVTDGSKVDVGVSSLEPTASLKSQCCVTDAYLDCKVAVSVITDLGFDTLDTLAGHKVGIIKDSTSATWAKSKLAQSTLVEFPDSVELFGALQAYNVDAVVSTLECAWYFLRMKLTNASVIASEDSDESYVMALGEDNEALRDALNSALSELKSDGSWQALYDEWFHETHIDPSAQESVTPEQGAPGYAKGA